MVDWKDKEDKQCKMYIVCMVLWWDLFIGCSFEASLVLDGIRKSFDVDGKYHNCGAII